MTRVLVIDDEPSILRALRINLTARNYEVSTAGDGASGLLAVSRERPDAVILDLGLPDMDGTEVIHGVRGWSTTPIIVLSVWGAEPQKVAALDAGADDYVTKPFGMDELLARMRALLRRPPAVQQPELAVGDLRFDPATREVRVGSRQPALTATEFGILELLVRKSPAVVPRRSIAVNVWDDESDAMGSNTIDVHLARLRAKLAGGMVRIETVRGVGYRLVER